MGHKWLGFGERAFVTMMKEVGFGGVNFEELPADPDGRGPGLFVCTGTRN
jgi:hypothetical protein